LAAVRRLFGTDGVRGVAGVDLTPELARRLGAAAARFALERSRDRSAEVVIGRDTRRSGPELERGVAEGVAAAGGHALLAGVLPTPGVATVGRTRAAALSCAVSASHNPWQDNGIKFLAGDGRKLSDEDEAAIERLLDAGGGAAGGDLRELPDAAGVYEAWLLERFADAASGLRGRFGLDCANGAAVAVAPRLLRDLGADFDAIGVDPDGVNINAGVGSTHLDALRALVREHRLAFGLAFDGDADRCLAVDSNGTLVDGDRIIAVLAIDLKRRGELAKERVVVTSMTNLAFHRLMERHGIAVEVTDVGDRYVTERMQGTGAVLGGEQSGHVVWSGPHTTGDGLATALMLVRALDRLDMSMDDAASVFTSYPQRLVGVRADRSRLVASERIWQEVEKGSAALGREGRVLVRASGTEPLVRVMVEAADDARCDSLCEEIAAVVRSEIGIEE
jgi:phosphoglucosamine mutase